MLDPLWLKSRIIIHREVPESITKLVALIDKTQF
ncbi:hypothetical protein RHRU231_450204 [Rhodococcus ruber]|uniref:Uncharacterized protein n=1 Tax=Rhodococcus ruber TaxID=1830 RepID=A0A098BLG1_9NOCA|nr:hypothetical protein RHRU231_450204 [Rhodococcus ruber]